MCLKVPFLGKLPKGAGDQHPDRFWSCSQIASLSPEQATEKEFKHGNYVQFDVQIEQVNNLQLPFLNIIDINLGFCDPPEKECNCDELIDRLLTSKEGHDLEDPAKKDLPMHMAMDHIQFDYSRETCQCLLRAAEKLGFEYARILDSHVTGDCANRRVIDSNVYESSPLFLCEVTDRREGFFFECEAERIAVFKEMN